MNRILQNNVTNKTFLFFNKILKSISGSCLYMIKYPSVVNEYDCEHFSYGCPVSVYTSDTIYTCKYDGHFTYCTFLCNLASLTMICKKYFCRGM